MADGGVTRYESRRTQIQIGGALTLTTAGLLAQPLIQWFGFVVGWLIVYPPVMVLGFWWTRRVGVDESDEGLLVRNVFRTHRVRWDEIERWERGRAWLPSASWHDAVCAVAVTTDGRRVTLLGMPVGEQRRNRPPRRFKAAAIIERWEASLAAART